MRGVVQNVCTGETRCEYKHRAENSGEYNSQRFGRCNASGNSFGITPARKPGDRPVAQKVSIAEGDVTVSRLRFLPLSFPFPEFDH